MTTQPKPNQQIPIDSHDQLTDYFRQGARPEEQWGIGAEMEKLVLDAESGEVADYDRIEQLLLTLADCVCSGGPWERLTEKGRLIGLKGIHSSITLEPGGQLELSGQLCRDLFCNHGDFAQHVLNLLCAGKDLGLVFLGLGTQPFTPLEEIAWVPKARYDVMGPYMLKTGDMGQRMMKQSAGLQVNLDYSDETDCIAKMRLAQALAPLLYALFANSPILEDRPTGFLSTRGEIWSRTDRDRTGLLPFLFRDDAGFADYVDYALDVPMYFLCRDNRYLDLTGRRFTFRDFLEQGYENQQPLLSDWDTHLSTLFPEVRLRPQIEVRSADSLPPGLALSVAALLKGLLYDPEARQQAWELCQPESPTALQDQCRTAWTRGLKTPWRQGTLQDLARDCLTLAKQGLRRQAERHGYALDETCYLYGLDELIESGTTLAERLLREWHGSRQEKLESLFRHCGFPGSLPLE